MRMNNQVYWSSVYCTEYNIYDRKSSLVWTFAKWKKTKQTNKIIPILVVNSENQMNVADYENKTIEKNASTQLGVVSVSQVEQPWFVHWATRNQMCMSRTHWVKFWAVRVSTSPRVTQAMKPSLKCFRDKKVHCMFSKGTACLLTRCTKKNPGDLSMRYREKNPQPIYCHSWNNGLGELKKSGRPFTLRKYSGKRVNTLASIR